MDGMKFDMCGAGLWLLGTIQQHLCEAPTPNSCYRLRVAWQQKKYAFRGHAARPGDVMTTMSGQTAGIVNTTRMQKGRLVLPIGTLTYIKRFNPALIDRHCDTYRCMCRCAGQSRPRWAILSDDEHTKFTTCWRTITRPCTLAYACDGRISRTQLDSPVCRCCSILVRALMVVQ